MGKVLAAFVAWASMPSNTVAAGNLRGLIDRALDRKHARHLSHLAASASIPLSTLSGLPKKQGLPSLQILVRLAGAARVPLASIFSAVDMPEDGPGPPHGLKRLARLKTNRRHLWAEVQREVNAVVASGEAVSLQQLSRRFGVDQSALVDNISSEARQVLLERGKVARVQARQSRLAELVARIREAVDQLSAEGVRASARTVSEHLDARVGTPYFRVAYKMARADT